MFDYSNCQPPAMRGIDAGNRIAASVETITDAPTLLTRQLAQIVKAGLGGDSAYFWPAYDNNLQTPEQLRAGAAAVLLATGPRRRWNDCGSVIGAAREVAMSVAI